MSMLPLQGKVESNGALHSEVPRKPRVRLRVRIGAKGGVRVRVRVTGTVTDNVKVGVSGRTHFRQPTHSALARTRYHQWAVQIIVARHRQHIVNSQEGIVSAGMTPTCMPYTPPHYTHAMTRSQCRDDPHMQTAMLSNIEAHFCGLGLGLWHWG